MPRSTATTAVATLTCAALLAGCAPEPAITADPFAEQIEHAQGARPLPPGSRYEAADSHAPSDRGMPVPYTTLPPGPGGPEQRVPEIRKRGRIVIGVEQSMNLLSYRDASTGALTGFEIDLGREIARDVFGDPAAADFRLIEPSGPVPSLANGMVDMVLRASSVTPSRMGRADFSAPYLATTTGLLTTRDSGITSLAETDDARVCVTEKSPLEEMVRTEAPGTTLLLAKAWGDCLVALQQHQADVIVSDMTILAGIAAQEPGAVIRPLPSQEDVYAAGVANGRDGLIRQINATMERIRDDGTWETMYNRWFGDYLPFTPMPPPSYAERRPASPAPPAGEAQPTTTREEGR